MTVASTDLRLGPEVDAAPRPLPARVKLRGRHVELEPLHRRHTADLFAAAQGADASFTYTRYGPYASEAQLVAQIDAWSSAHDPLLWAVRPVVSGQASGWIALLDIQPGNAAIEIGNIWFSPRMQRTRAATEALFMVMRLAIDELGYRRLTWKCDSLNVASRRAAERLGFRYEGLLRAHMVVKGRQRDTAYYSILADEWPRCAAALAAWLDPANFGPDGTALRGLAEIRNDAAPAASPVCYAGEMRGGNEI